MSLTVEVFPFPPALRTGWKDDAAPERNYPAPLRTSREPAVEELSGTISPLRALAQSQGWRTAVTRAEGWLPHATYGTPGAAPLKSVALRCARRDEQVRAVYMGGKWLSLWYWSGTTFFTRLPTLDITRITLALAEPVPFLRMIGLVK